MARKKLTADEVSTSAKLAGVPPALALAIWDQESSSGGNTQTSNRGAQGDFQMLPTTFNQYNPGGNIKDPVDNMNAALSYISTLLKKYDGDWEKVGQAYYHGSALPPGVEGPTSGKGTPTTRQYGKQIADKAKQNDLNSLASPPAGTTSTAKGDLFGNPMGASGAPGNDLVQWRNMNAQPGQPPPAPLSAPGDLGSLGPSAPTPGGYGDINPQAMQQGSANYDMDGYIRQLVDEIV